jgi:hypothetical protein
MNQYTITNADFDFIWENIESPLIVRDRINVIKSRSHPYNPQAERQKVLDDLVLWNDTREVFHLVLNYKRHLRSKDDQR